MSMSHRDAAPPTPSNGHCFCEKKLMLAKEEFLRGFSTTLHCEDSETHEAVCDRYEIMNLPGF